MRAVVGLALVIGGVTFGALVLTGHIPPGGGASTQPLDEPGVPRSDPGAPRPPGGGGGGTPSTIR